MLLTLRHAVRPARRSLATASVCELFGLDDREESIIVCDELTLDVKPSDLVLFLGPSGSGKSTLLRAVATALNATDVATIELPDQPLIEALAGPVVDRIGLLSTCGLAEPRLALRTPLELSDGQRTRFRIAYALQQSTTLAIDEFAALLDRPLAKVLATNLRRMVTRTGIGALVATTHDDIADELNPNVLVHCRGDGNVTATRFDVKKKRPIGTARCGSRLAPDPTGRTSLGGIIAGTGSASSRK